MRLKYSISGTGIDGGILSTSVSIPTKPFHDKMAAENLKNKTMMVLSSIQSWNNVFMDEEGNRSKSY